MTRLLQPSLSGKACVNVICTVSPSSGNIEETISTLKFAARAKKIKNTYVNINEILDESALLRQYREEIERLKSELKVYKEQQVLHQQLLAVREKEQHQQQQSQKQLLQVKSNHNAAAALARAVVLSPANSSSSTYNDDGNVGEQESINALTAQIEALTRLILTSSQVPREAEMDADESGNSLQNDEADEQLQQRYLLEEQQLQQQEQQQQQQQQLRQPQSSTGQAQVSNELDDKVSISHVLPSQ